MKTNTRLLLGENTDPGGGILKSARTLMIAVDFGDSGGRTALNQLSIATITRVAVPNQEGYPERTYYRWRIELNLPQGGEITFGASGFTQTLRAEPVLLDEQRLAAVGRP